MGFPSPGSRVRAPFAAPFINYIYEEHTFSVHLNRPKLITANGDWQTFRFKCPVWRKSNKRKRPVTAGTDKNPETLREKPAKPIPNSFRQLYPQGMEIVYRTSEKPVFWFVKNYSRQQIWQEFDASVYSPPEVTRREWTLQYVRWHEVQSATAWR